MDALRKTLDEEDKNLDNSNLVSPTDGIPQNLHLQFVNSNNPVNNFMTPSSTTELEPRINEYKVYKRRWIILAIFVLYSATNALQWIQYSIIANIVQKYYGISSTFVDWTSMIYMIVYIPLIFPASWLLDKMGLRVAAILGSCGTCLGAIIKCFSVSPNLFWVGFIGQSTTAVSQIFILSLPARLAAVWFGPNQVSSACSIGVFGNQLGVAVGFLLPPILVKNHDDIDLIGRDLQNMFYLIAGICVMLLALVVFFFRAEPPTPPSAAQDKSLMNVTVNTNTSINASNIKENESENSASTAVLKNNNDFFMSVKRLLTNWGYNLLLGSYGINVGVFYALSTLLNQIVLQYYPGHEEDAGRIGLTIVLAGMLGSVVCGVVLDKTHRFKETTLAVYGFSMIGMVVYTFTLSCGYISVVYITSALLGFFMTGYLPVGFEFGSELTYPEPEGTSAGLLNAAAQTFGILFTMAYSKILDDFGDLAANLALCFMLLIGTIMTAAIKSDLRRQRAHNLIN